MSPREQLQNDIVNYLSNRSGVFNAPYGILPSIENLKTGGKVRTITFGVARYLDATIYIFSPTNIAVRCSGPLYHKLNDKYKSYAELIADLDKFGT